MVVPKRWRLLNADIVVYYIIRLYLVLLCLIDRRIVTEQYAEK